MTLYATTRPCRRAQPRGPSPRARRRSSLLCAKNTAPQLSADRVSHAKIALSCQPQALHSARSAPGAGGGGAASWRSSAFFVVQSSWLGTGECAPARAFRAACSRIFSMWVISVPVHRQAISYARTDHLSASRAATGERTDFGDVLVRQKQQVAGRGVPANEDWFGNQA